MFLRLIFLFILVSILVTIFRIVKLVFRSSAAGNAKNRNYRSPNGPVEKDISKVAKIIEEKPLDKAD